MGFINFFWLLFYVIISINLISCNDGISRQKILDGEFGNIDRTPPTLVSPPNNEKIFSKKIVFVWSQKLEAYNYKIEIAFDEFFIHTPKESS